MRVEIIDNRSGCFRDALFFGGLLGFASLFLCDLFRIHQIFRLGHGFFQIRVFQVMDRVNCAEDDHSGDHQHSDQR